jgi:hypothetical protein
MQLMIGTRVKVRDAYLDSESTEPVTGTVEDIFENGYPDEHGHYDGVPRYVSMFDHDDPNLPPRRGVHKGGTLPRGEAKSRPLAGLLSAAGVVSVWSGGLHRGHNPHG